MTSRLYAGCVHRQGGHLTPRDPSGFFMTDRFCPCVMNGSSCPQRQDLPAGRLRPSPPRLRAGGSTGHFLAAPAAGAQASANIGPVRGHRCRPRATSGTSWPLLPPVRNRRCAADTAPGFSNKNATSPAASAMTMVLVLDRLLALVARSTRRPPIRPLDRRARDQPRQPMTPSGRFRLCCRRACGDENDAR